MAYPPTVSGNTLSNRTYRDFLLNSFLQKILYSNTVTMDVANMHLGEQKVYQNPFLNPITVTVAALTGAYTPGVLTTTDETLVVNKQITAPVYIADWEQKLSVPDLFNEFAMNAASQCGVALDKQVLTDALATSGIATIAVTGGFQTFGVNKALGNIQGILSGYELPGQEMFLVIENTDVAAFVLAQISTGFQAADKAIDSNAMLGTYLGIKVYKVRAGQHPANHRLAGIRRRIDVALAGSWKTQEKDVANFLGKEIVVYTYYGFQIWTQNKPLVVDVNIT